MRFRWAAFCVGVFVQAFFSLYSLPNYCALYTIGRNLELDVFSCVWTQQTPQNQRRRASSRDVNFVNVYSVCPSGWWWDMFDTIARFLNATAEYVITVCVARRDGLKRRVVWANEKPTPFGFSIWQYNRICDFWPAIRVVCDVFFLVF